MTNDAGFQQLLSLLESKKATFIAGAPSAYPDGTPTYADGHISNMLTVAARIAQADPNDNAFRLAVQWAAIWCSSADMPLQAHWLDASRELMERLSAPGWEWDHKAAVANGTALLRLWELDGRMMAARDEWAQQSGLT